MIEISRINAVGVPRPELFVVNWNIGKRCNYACSYCPKDLHDRQSPHARLPQLQAGLERVLAMLRKRGEDRRLRLEFTGGEPTLNPDFLDFVRWIKAMHGDVAQVVGLTTNGSRTAHYHGDLLPFVDYITFSAHFEFLDPDHFIQVVLLTARAARSAAGSPPKPISVNVMDEPWSAEAVADLVAILDAEGVFVRRCRVRNHYASTGLTNPRGSRFDYPSFLQRHGDPPPNRPGAADPGNHAAERGAGPPSPAIGDARELSDPVARTQGYVELHLEDGRNLWALPSTLIDGGLNRFQGWLCETGRDSIHIYNDGTVYGSVCRASPLGNVFEGFAIEPSALPCPWERCVCSSDVRIFKRRANGDVRPLCELAGPT